MHNKQLHFKQTIIDKLRKIFSREEVIFVYLFDFLARDEEKRVDFEIETIYRYFDFKPYLDEYNYLIQEKIMREGKESR